MFGQMAVDAAAGMDAGALFGPAGALAIAGRANLSPALPGRMP